MLIRLVVIFYLVAIDIVGIIAISIYAVRNWGALNIYEIPALGLTTLVLMAIIILLFKYLNKFMLGE